jgi:hypothetical protein
MDRTRQDDRGSAVSTWKLLALSDPELEQADIVRVNVSVARELTPRRDLDVGRYCRIVDNWIQQFARWLPGAEAAFRRTPEKWKNDIHFFRVGMLAGFLGHEIGIRYKDEQKHAQAVRYTNPSDLFLNGLIDTKQGTCASMPTLHVAMARRMGWPVSLAAVKSHFISRYDDGKVYHNIEATDTHPGSFASGSDEDYIGRYTLPRKAIACGSDLRRLSAREMLGIFIAFRARHYADIGDVPAADRDYALARVLVPCHRQTYLGAMMPMLNTGTRLFDPDEVGHPDSLRRDGGATNESSPPSRPRGTAPLEPGTHVLTISPDSTGTGILGSMWHYGGRSQL